MEPTFTKRSWLEIDLTALKANYRTACSLTAARVTCVVKSNAYGHGAVRVAQALQEAGCASFAVSCAREALELRRAGITGEMLVMGLCDADRLEDCIAQGGLHGRPARHRRGSRSGASPGGSAPEGEHGLSSPGL